MTDTELAELQHAVRKIYERFGFLEDKLGVWEGSECQQCDEPIEHPENPERLVSVLCNWCGGPVHVECIDSHSPVCAEEVLF